MKAQAREACTCVSVCMYTFTQANTTCLFACIHSHKVIPHALHTHMYRVKANHWGRGVLICFYYCRKSLCWTFVEVSYSWEMNLNYMEIKTWFMQQYKLPSDFIMHT